MTIRLDSDLIEGLVGVYLFVALCTIIIVITWNMLKVVSKLMGWIYLRAEGVRDLYELRIRSETRHAEWVKHQIAHGQPATLGGVYKLVGRRIWTAYRHPIRAWRGEFDPPKRDLGGTGDSKL
jgi:hypothetical protein